MTEVVLERGTKRPRPAFRTKRPIAKELISVNGTGLNTTQVNTGLFTATFPCTITGLRWDLASTMDAGTGLAKADWVIVINREGNTVDTIVSSNGNTTYNPEQDVLAFGVMYHTDGVTNFHTMGSTKTMRKMQGGDSLQFLIRGSDASNTLAWTGIIQFFCKS